MQALVHCCSRVCAGSAQLFCSPKRACLFLCLWPPRPFPGRVHQQVHSRPSGAWRDRCNEKDGHATDEGRQRGGVAPGMWGSCAAPNAPLFRPPDLCSVLFELYSLHHSGLLQAVNCEQATTTQAQGIYECRFQLGAATALLDYSCTVLLGGHCPRYQLCPLAHRRRLYQHAGFHNRLCSASARRVQQAQQQWHGARSSRASEL